MKCLLFVAVIFLALPVYAQTDRATQFRERLAEALSGDAGAQDDVGVMYAEADGVKRNYRKAVFWLQQSAAQGHVLGACNLALHYARGQGIRKNPILALKWAFISHSLDGLKCFPDDFAYFFKPRRSAVRKAWSLADAFLKTHPNLTNEFGERPWLKTKWNRTTRSTGVPTSRDVSAHKNGEATW